MNRGSSALNLQTSFAVCSKRLEPEALYLSEGSLFDTKAFKFSLSEINLKQGKKGEGMKKKWDGSNLKLGTHSAHKGGVTMYRLIPTSRIGLKLLTAALVIGFQVFFASTAQAHHPEISAESVCNDNGFAEIDYTATSWSTTSKIGENSQIDISVEGNFVESGAFKKPKYAFSGSFLAPNGSPGTTVTVTATAAVAWGDGYPGGQSRGTSVLIPNDCGLPANGRFTGGGNTITLQDNIKVTDGLTIHCDKLLSNNLEVNWPGGNNFHMEDHITTVGCTDDPNIIQAPPKAPLDTLIGIGTGKFNNVDGYTIEFTLVDGGEPGTSDKIALKIYETANPANVVLNVPLQFVTKGNLQAHFDQPHK